MFKSMANELLNVRTQFTNELLNHYNHTLVNDVLNGFDQEESKHHLIVEMLNLLTEYAEEHTPTYTSQILMYEVIFTCFPQLDFDDSERTEFDDPDDTDEKEIYVNEYSGYNSENYKNREKNRNKYMELLLMFVEDDPDLVNWERIVKNVGGIDESFLDEFSEYFDENTWDYISQDVILSEDFIKKYKDKVNWFEILTHQDLSEEFIKEIGDVLKNNFQYGFGLK